MSFSVRRKVRAIRSPYSFQSWLGNGVSTDPYFFPFQVWAQGIWASEGVDFPAIGITSYFSSAPGLTDGFLTFLGNYNLYAIEHQNSLGLTDARAATTIKGWMHVDEPDNAKKQPDGTYTPLEPVATPDKLLADYATYKANDSLGRPVFINLGRGVAASWVGLGFPADQKDVMYPRYCEAADVLSFDIYPVNSALPLTVIADGVENLRRWSGGNKPIYAFIETVKGGVSNPEPTAAQIEAEIWLAIIHGAAGISFFCHGINAQGSFAMNALLTNTARMAELKTIIARVKSYAPIINSSIVTNGPTTSITSVHLCSRVQGRTLYIFAVNTQSSATTAVITVPYSGDTSLVTVSEEGRSVGLAAGSFEDSFEPYQVQVYQLAF